MFCRPTVLCALNCITEIILVTEVANIILEGRMLASPGLDIDPSGL
jgi:hypothetical protein